MIFLQDESDFAAQKIGFIVEQIIDSDIIFVLKQGRVVESGTHEQLYENGKTYREIFDASARSLNLDKISRTLEIEEIRI